MKHQTKIIFGGFMGSVVEAYDSSICYFLSVELSRVLIGNHQGNPSVILTLIFLGYLAKPFGAFVLGMFSDRYGRKNVLIMSILIMGLATTLIGLIPSYQRIGIYAGGLLLVLRILQSMALGSEFLNSAFFLVESGDNSRKGFRGCWPSVGVKVGFFLACVIVEIIQTQNAHWPALQDWLWRIPFLLALLTTLTGVFIRYNMPESLAYIVYYAEHSRPTMRTIYNQAKNFTIANPFLLNYAFFTSFLSVAIGFFYYLYIPLHAIQYSHLPRSFIMGSTALSLVFVTLLIPIFGKCSDHQDRLRMLAIAAAGLLILAYPFMFAINSGNSSYFLLMQLLISIPCACYYSVSSVLLTELFPLQIRCTTLSIVYSVAASLASGLPPLLANYLAAKTQLPNSPCLIIMVIACIVLVNAKILSQRYRVGPNQYNLRFLGNELPSYTIQYQKPLIT